MVSSSSGKMKYNAVSIPVTAPSPLGMSGLIIGQFTEYDEDHSLGKELYAALADLVKACAQEFGFTRMGSNIDTVMQRGINKAIKKNYAKIDNEKVTIAD